MTAKGGATLFPPLIACTFGCIVIISFYYFVSLRNNLMNDHETTAVAPRS